ncbi:Ivy family C-type lysozyme inhibitor, partial [Klebsiella pneumoniae]|uniref:Ivy family C-type lysozyme inhibitor n=1 Tax=Klebsiella pneumoniae TaxID=573 RepID=UPI00336A2D99
MFKALTAIVALAASASVMAQGDVTLNSLAHDAATRASFNQMVKGHQLPAWVTTGGTGSPAQTVKLGSESWQVLSACKPHDCGHERIAVIWSEKSKQMPGVYSVVDEKTNQDRIICVNVREALSIEG